MPENVAVLASSESIEEPPVPSSKSLDDVGPVTVLGAMRDQRLEEKRRQGPARTLAEMRSSESSLKVR